MIALSLLEPQFGRTGGIDRKVAHLYDIQFSSDFPRLNLISGTDRSQSDCLHLLAYYSSNALTSRGAPTHITLPSLANMGGDDDKPDFSCRCLNVRIHRRQPGPDVDPQTPSSSEPGYEPLFVGEDGVVVVCPCD